MLEAVGVQPDEERVYTLLIQGAPCAPTELSNRSGLSPRQTTRALTGLVHKGLANRVPGRSAQYVAVAPDMAVEALVQSREEELRTARAAVHRLMKDFHEARTPDPARVIEVITGEDNVMLALEQVQRIATTEVRALSRPPYAADPAGRNDIEYAKLAQSVRYRAVWDKEALEIPGVLKMIYKDIRRGEETRIFSGVPIKLVIADDRCALLPRVRLGTSGQSAIRVHPSELLDSLAALFELVWAQAQPVRATVNDRARPDGGEPTEAQRTLLELLANGLTDEAIGHSLGWSLRTVQRHVRQLMDILGADIRFQAGMAAAKRGWL